LTRRSGKADKEGEEERGFLENEIQRVKT